MSVKKTKVGLVSYLCTNVSLLILVSGCMGDSHQTPSVLDGLQSLRSRHAMCPVEFSISYRSLTMSSADEQPHSLEENDHSGYQKELNRFNTLKKIVDRMMKQAPCAVLNGEVVDPTSDAILSHLDKEVNENISKYEVSVRYASALDTLDQTTGIKFLSNEGYDIETILNVFDTDHFVESGKYPTVDNVQDALVEFETELAQIVRDHSKFLNTVHGSNLSLYLEKSRRTNDLFLANPLTSRESETFYDFYHPLEKPERERRKKQEYQEELDRKKRENLEREQKKIRESQINKMESDELRSRQQLETDESFQVGNLYESLQRKLRLELVYQREGLQSDEAALRAKMAREEEKERHDLERAHQAFLREINKDAREEEERRRKQAEQDRQDELNRKEWKRKIEEENRKKEAGKAQNVNKYVYPAKIDLCHALGLGRPETVTHQEIRKAVKKQQFLLHPDKYPESEKAKKTQEFARFQNLIDAYKALYGDQEQERKIGR